MILLAIETSSRRSSVAIARHGEVAFDSDMAVQLMDGFDLAKLVAHAFETTDVPIEELSAVAVDVGPGGLNAVRAGVTFANGLALSRGIPMIAATSMEIMAHQAATSTGLPVICIRGATRENASLVVHGGPKPAALSFGDLSTLARSLADLRGPYAVAGRFRTQLMEVLPAMTLIDSGVEGPTAAGLLALATRDTGADRRAAPPISIIYPDGPAT